MPGSNIKHTKYIFVSGGVISGIGKGRILAGNTMDAHNTFAAPNTIQPVSYSGTSENGKASFDLPGGAVAVVALGPQ